MNLFLATNNTGKLKEIVTFFQLEKAKKKLSIFSSKALGGMPEVNETENTFEGNARLKAMALVKKIEAKDWVLADDSGLEVDALNGAPGVFSSRYAGVNASDKDNNEKLLKALRGTEGIERRARFRCCLVIMNTQKKIHIFNGVCEGAIANKPSGVGGFGYDPLFIPQGYHQPFAALAASIKNQISHRADALKQLCHFFELNL